MGWLLPFSFKNYRALSHRLLLLLGFQAWADHVARSLEGRWLVARRVKASFSPIEPELASISNRSPPPLLLRIFAGHRQAAGCHSGLPCQQRGWWGRVASQAARSGAAVIGRPPAAIYRCLARVEQEAACCHNSEANRPLAVASRRGPHPHPHHRSERVQKHPSPSRQAASHADPTRFPRTTTTGHLLLLHRHLPTFFASSHTFSPFIAVGPGAGPQERLGD